MRDGLARSRRITNPFAPGLGLVLRVLFAEGERTRSFGPVSISMIVERTQLHPTTIARVAASLARLGFVARKGHALTLVRPGAAFDAWVETWEGREQATRSFHVGLAWRALWPMLNDAWHGMTWAWTGAAGAALVAPIGVPLHKVCYVAERDIGVALERLKRGLPVMPAEDGCGTLHVVVPGTERAQLTFGGRMVHRGIAPVVSTIQLALDLERGPGGSERRVVLETARAVLRDLLVATPLRPVPAAIAGVA